MGDGASDTKGVRRTFIVPAIKAFDHYDFTRAKISCSLTWLVAKAFGSDSIPEELLDPFYKDQYSQEHLKPPLVCLLQSAELYCRAGSLILRSDAVRPLLGHNAVIQALAQKGLYVTEQERLVTERDLASTPIHMSSHLALIDTLMMAYTVEMVSVERVVACVSRLGPTHSDLGPAHGNQHLDELPYDTEEAVITWINKVNGHLRDILVEEQKVRERSGPDATAAHKSRYRREAVQLSAPLLPLVDSLLKDNTDGCALAALLHHYCPSTLPLEDVCLKETMSLADSLYNLQLVQDFCRDNLNHCCHFSLEDMLYTHASIKSNYLVFMAELFWWFEVVKPSFVQPRVFSPQACEPVVGVVPVCSPANHRQADTPGSPANHRQAVSPGLPDESSLPPQSTAAGIIRRSASMSYVDGSMGTWPKERRSSSRGISFEIPLDGDPSCDPCVTPPPLGMRRSASSEGLGGFKVHHASRGAMRRHASLTPVTVNGQTAARHIAEEEEDCRDSHSQKPLGRQQTFTRRNQSRYSNGVSTENHRDSDAGLRGNRSGNHGGGASPTTPPSIEEALKIIHATERPHGTLGDGDHAFFLHHSPGPAPDPDPDPPPASGKGQDGADELNSASTEEVDTGIHVRTEDIQDSHDEDSSSLRDYSDMDPDWDPPRGRCCPLPQTPDRDGQRGRPGDPGGPEGREGGTASPASSSGGCGGVRMTSFAEQKFRKLEGRSSGGTTPESTEHNVPDTHTPEARSPVRPAQTPSSAMPSPRDPSHMLASEMVHLKMKLEEKRRAIEAQKKKVEEAFTRHRQRMGRTAFLNVVRRKGVIPSPSPTPLPPASPTPLPPSPGPGDPGLGRPERCKPDGAAPKSPCEDGGGPAPGELDLLEYTRSIERLNSSLGLLQTEMQRLARQQDRIMAMRDHTHPQQDYTHSQQDHTHSQQAWVIPAPAPSPHRQLRDLRSCSVAGRGSVGSLSPLLSSSGSPLGPRRSPGGLKRRPASFHARTPRTPRPADLKVAPFSRMLNTPTSVDSLPRLRRFSPSQTQLSSRAYLGHDEGPLEHGGGDTLEQIEGAGGGTGESREEEEGAGACCLPAGKPSAEGEERREGRRQNLGRQSREEVLSQPGSDAMSCRPAPSEGGGAGALGRRGLVEVPLSVLKPLDGHGLETGEGGAPGEGGVLREGGAPGEMDAEDQKMCCGFFFKDDLKGEEVMAVKRAALLERRERREKEAQERRQQQELEQEQRKEAIRLKAEEEQQKREEEKSRRDFIKNEYMRRKQLKLMDDMDDVIKPRPGSLKKKTRPKSIHRDVMESPKPSARATGVRPRGYSVSSVSLASLNLADQDSVLPDKRTPRPDSAEGFLSPSGSRNVEKDWEAESTTSSNNTEYTGPKLYKEPSAKSNKHIIQNALAHCCLAGKVNEGQKNKILDEMEKSEANNFLILFRDAGCQFRSVYAYFPEAEHITKLAGIGPRSITAKMVDGLYKYNSDRKQFSAIPAKTMSASVDAVTIASHLWQVKKQNTPRNLQAK